MTSVSIPSVVVGSDVNNYILGEDGITINLDNASRNLWIDETSARSRIWVVRNTGVLGFANTDLDGSGNLPDGYNSAEYASYWEIKGAALQLTRPLSQKVQFQDASESIQTIDKFVTYRFEIGDDEELRILKISLGENGEIIRTVVLSTVSNPT